MRVENRKLNDLLLLPSGRSRLAVWRNEAMDLGNRVRKRENELFEEAWRLDYGVWTAGGTGGSRAAQRGETT